MRSYVCGRVNNFLVVCSLTLTRAAPASLWCKVFNFQRFATSVLDHCFCQCIFETCHVSLPGVSCNSQPSSLWTAECNCAFRFGTVWPIWGHSRLWDVLVGIMRSQYRKQVKRNYSKRQFYRCSATGLPVLSKAPIGTKQLRNLWSRLHSPWRLCVQTC